MIANIRGGLGTQLIELLGWFSLANSRNEKITSIQINCGGMSDDGSGVNCLLDYVSLLFEELPCPVQVTDGFAKLGVFKKPELLRLILEHRSSALCDLGPLRWINSSQLPILHVRRGDYEWVPLETYIDYAKFNAVALIGNIPEDTAKVPGYDLSDGAVYDWLNAFYAPQVIGTSSTFLLSMLFIEPEKSMSFFKNQSGSVFDDVIKPILDNLSPNFPNLQWL